MKYNYYEDKNRSISVITDTHFGRKFKEGIPLNRRGEYEEKIISDFETFMWSCDSDIVIHAGDLFDSPFVSNEVLMRIYSIIFHAANRHPKTFYYFIAGNHDLSKNKTEQEYTSFNILENLLLPFPNVIFVQFTPDYATCGNEILLVPYSHFDDPDKIINDAIRDETKIIVGHFDDPVPESLKNFKGEKLSGHIHKKHITQDGTLFVGSFYPIAFGEESDDSIMETMTLEDYNKRDESELKYKRVRILLKDGEELPSESPCLQLIGKKERKEDINIDVKINADFDFKELFFDCLKNVKCADELWNRYLELKC